jgi:hypothetical protein
MRSKLLIVSTMMVIGMIAGCGKEEEAVPVSPVVEQAQPNTSAVAPVAPVVQVAEPTQVTQVAVPTTPVEQMPTVEQTAPAMPDQGMQANVQPQVQQLPTTVPASQTVETKSSPLVVDTNVQQMPTQPITVQQTPAITTSAVQESNAVVKDELAAVSNEATAPIVAPVAPAAPVVQTQVIGAQVKKVEAPIVIEQPKK